MCQIAEQLLMVTSSRRERKRQWPVYGNISTWEELSKAAKDLCQCSRSGDWGSNCGLPVHESGMQTTQLRRSIKPYELCRGSRTGGFNTTNKKKAVTGLVPELVRSTSHSNYVCPLRSILLLSCLVLGLAGGHFRRVFPSKILYALFIQYMLPSPS